MKKLACLLLVTILLFSFSACSTENVSISNSEVSSNTETHSNTEMSSDVVNPSNVGTQSDAETLDETELNDLHNVTQSQNSTPNISQDFESITDNEFSGGNGTQSNPYLITTSKQLIYLSEKINSGEMNNGVHFALGADIDMVGVEFLPIGNGTYRFSSNFDGRGFTISNLSPKLLYDDYGNNANYSCGFFGIVGNAEIKNLHLENVNITYTYESNYFTEIGLLAGCVYPTRECKITDCIVNGNINVETDVLLVGGIVGDIFVTDNAKLKCERLQSNTKLQVRSDSVNAGAISGSLLGSGEEIFTDICVQSEILHSSTYYSYVGAFGGVANSKGSMSVSNCFIKINTNKKYGDNVHPLIGGIIDSYQPSGTFDFINVFGFADGCTKLYEIPSENLVKEENCSFVNVLPANCNFNTEIWDITDPATPFIKLNFQKN